MQRNDARDVSEVLAALSRDGKVKMFGSVNQEGNEVWHILEPDGTHGHPFTRWDMLKELRKLEAEDPASLPLLASGGGLPGAVATYLLGCPTDDSGLCMVRLRHRHRRAS